jgi:hypothetical protein
VQIGFVVGCLAPHCSTSLNASPLNGCLP